MAHNPNPAHDPEDDQIVENEVDQSVDSASDTEGSPAEGDEQPRPQPSAREQRLQRRLTEQGRRTAAAETAAAEARRNNEVLAAQMNNLEAKLSDMGNYLSTEQQRQQDTYLQSLPAEQRALAKIDMLERRLAGTGQPTTAQAASPQHQAAAPPDRQPNPDVERERIEYARRRSQEILDDLSDEFDVELDKNMEGLDYTSEAAFRGSATAIARMMAGGAMPKKKDTEGSSAANRPMSPRAVPRKRGAPATPEDFNKVLSSYDSRKGPRATKRALEKMTGG